jgi:hypothetical protein
MRSVSGTPRLVLENGPFSSTYERRQDFCGKLRHCLPLVRYLGYLRYCRINKLRVFNSLKCRCPILTDALCRLGWESTDPCRTTARSVLQNVREPTHEQQPRD